MNNGLPGYYNGSAGRNSSFSHREAFSKGNPHGYEGRKAACEWRRRKKYRIQFSDAVQNLPRFAGFHPRSCLKQPHTRAYPQTNAMVTEPARTVNGIMISLAPCLLLLS